MKQFMVLLDGPMGAGKTTVANVLHKKLARTAVVSRDRIKWFVSDFARTREDNELADAVLFAMLKTYADHGLSIVIDHSFIQKGSMKPFVAFAKRKKLRLFSY